LFTRIPDFFFHHGFREADRTAMPDKVYKDCQNCPRLNACDEISMVRGPMPKVAVLGPQKLKNELQELVQLGNITLQTGTR
jgi:amino-acid N-acetyltransferase